MRYADRGITSTTRIFAGDRSRGVGTFLPLLNNEDVLDEFTIVGATTVSFDFEESDAKLGEPDSASSLVRPLMMLVERRVVYLVGAIAVDGFWLTAPRNGEKGFCLRLVRRPGLVLRATKIP